MQKITISLQKEDWEKLIDICVIEMRPANMQAEYILINAIRNRETQSPSISVTQPAKRKPTKKAAVTQPT